jgi:hypothetical protein
VIRIRQMSENHSGNHRLMISGFEIFGYVFDFNNLLTGLIEILTQQCGGNVHDRGLVSVTVSGHFKDSFPKNAANLGSDSSFFSVNEPNQWICYDFQRNIRIKPSKYLLRTDSNGPCPKEWLVEGSNDGSSWTEFGSPRRSN